MRSVELFAGGGGLALGAHMAGFNTAVVAEWNHWCCDTLRRNQAAGHPLVQGADIQEGDVRDLDWPAPADAVELVSGGPPCQPFSGGGLGLAAGDPRDMFPATAEAIRQLRPKAFLVENVRGLTRPKFADYFSYIQLRLAHPELTPREGESWADHFRRLQAEHTAVRQDLSYKVVANLVNAADYGVPQQRWRVFLVGFRCDVDAEWSFPQATHSARALAHSQDVTGEYWERHRVARKGRTAPAMAPGLFEVPAASRPWRTVRDAISDLPEPTTRGSRQVLNHV
ncbi:MAG: DNA cytosine methyltransferase, partial [Propionibacteriaceae bacterium]|nr:DNA cytosine methyltransferase [Propionibacteriaceae bacterium]